MNIIGFSHHYTKMHGQTTGTLISVKRFFVDAYNMSVETLEYDTQYLAKNNPDDPADESWHTGYSEDLSLTSGDMVQLVFIGDKQIPFTTYRKMPSDHRFALYCDKVGEQFKFNFKGECRPGDYDTSENDVIIVE